MIFFWLPDDEQQYFEQTPTYAFHQMNRVHHCTDGRRRSRMQFKWLQQNRYEIDDLYNMVSAYRESNGSSFLSLLTYDRFLTFVIANSQTIPPNPYLPTNTDNNVPSCEDDANEHESGSDEVEYLDPEMPTVNRRKEK